MAVVTAGETRRDDARQWAVGLFAAAVALIPIALLTPWAGIGELAVLVLAARRVRTTPQQRPWLWGAIIVASLALLVLVAATVTVLAFTTSWQRS